MQSEKTNPYTRNVVRHPVIVVLVALLAFSSCLSGLIPWQYKIGAMSNDDPGKINTILSSGYDVNRRDINGQTALMVAAFRGHVETVKLLLHRGADVNVRDRLGATALMYAAFFAGKDNPRQKCPEIIDLLVNQGADVNAVDKRGTTPLMFAAAHRETELARRMIQHGADTRAKNANGVTAGIFYALRFDDPGEVATVEMLGGPEVACPPDVAVLFFPAYNIYLNEGFPPKLLADVVKREGGGPFQVVYSRSVEWEYERATMAFLRPRTYHLGVGYSSSQYGRYMEGTGTRTTTGKLISIPFEPQDGHVYILRYAFDEINGKSAWRAWIDEIPTTPRLDRRDTDN